MTVSGERTTPDEDMPDPPDAPAWLSHEAAYGFSCGWTAGYRAAFSDRDVRQGPTESNRTNGAPDA